MALSIEEDVSVNERCIPYAKAFSNEGNLANTQENHRGENQQYQKPRHYWEEHLVAQ